MTMNTFRGDLTDTPAKIEALAARLHLLCSILSLASVQPGVVLVHSTLLIVLVIACIL